MRAARRFGAEAAPATFALEEESVLVASPARPESADAAPAARRRSTLRGTAGKRNAAAVEPPRAEDVSALEDAVPPRPASRRPNADEAGDRAIRSLVSRMAPRPMQLHRRNACRAGNRARAAARPPAGGWRRREIASGPRRRGAPCKGGPPAATPDEIRITIGRVEVIAAPPPRPRAAAPAPKATSLEDYLRRRERAPAMSNSLAISGVTAMLQYNLGVAYSSADPPFASLPTITCLAPDQVQGLLGGVTEDENQVNLFLHQVTHNPGWRNADLPSLGADGKTKLKNPPLALDLHYLLTVYGSDNWQAEALLGCALLALHDNPGSLSRRHRRRIHRDGRDAAAEHRPAGAASVWLGPRRPDRDDQDYALDAWAARRWRGCGRR